MSGMGNEAAGLEGEVKERKCARTHCHNQQQNWIEWIMHACTWRVAHSALELRTPV